MRIVLAVVLALAAACGDDFQPGMLQPDAGITPDPDAAADAMVDAPVEDVTLTSYVTDLIVNGTSNMAAARPYTEFATLPDPDGTTNNTSAYSSLFP